MHNFDICHTVHKMSEKTWGGRRKGAGRPKVTIKRTLRAVRFFDEEWELIQQKAKSLNLSPRAYIFQLVEQDK